MTKRTDSWQHTGLKNRTEVSIYFSVIGRLNHGAGARLLAKGATLLDGRRTGICWSYDRLRDFLKLKHKHGYTEIVVEFRRSTHLGNHYKTFRRFGLHE